MKIQFLVELDVPEGATVDDCSDYIADAIRCWGKGSRPPGSLDDNDPGDPFFSLDQDSVVIYAR